MKKIHLFILLNVIFVWSCSTDPEYESPAGLFDLEMALQSEPFPAAPGNFVMPYHIMIIDSLMVSRDLTPKDEEVYLFSLFNRHTGDRQSVFGRRGRGPDEFSDQVFISRIPGRTRHIGIKNRQNFSFVELSIDSVLNHANRLTVTTYENFDTGFSSLVKMDQENFVMKPYTRLRRMQTEKL